MITHQVGPFEYMLRPFCIASVETCTPHQDITLSSPEGVHVVTVNDYLARRDAEWVAWQCRGLELRMFAFLEIVRLLK